MTTLYLCGAGNSEGVRLAVLLNARSNRWNRLVILDDDSSKHGTTQLGVEIAGSFQLLEDVDPSTTEVANLVARTTKKRWDARERIRAFGDYFTQLISPGVETLGADLGQDLIVYQNATVGPEITVGDGSVVFMGAAIGHECVVGECCIVAANAVLNARVRLGTGVYVGSNATVLPEIEVGDWATIGAGSVVVEDVAAGCTVMGVPVQPLTSPPAERAGRQATKAESDRFPGSDPAGSMETANLEKEIARIWGDQLQVANVPPERNFFDLGGSSLLALRITSRIRDLLGRDFPVTDLFAFPTVRSLAGHLAGSAGNGSAPSPAAIRGRQRKDRLALRTSTRSPEGRKVGQ